MRKQLFLAAALYAMTIQALSASFDCSQASTSIEKTICSSPELSRLDEQLSTAFRHALGIMNNPGALKDEQRYWLAKQRTQCLDAEGCLRKTYQERINELSAISPTERREFFRCSYKAGRRTQDKASADIVMSITSRSARVQWDTWVYSPRLSDPVNCYLDTDEADAPVWKKTVVKDTYMFTNTKTAECSFSVRVTDRKVQFVAGEAYFECGCAMQAAYWNLTLDRQSKRCAPE